MQATAPSAGIMKANLLRARGTCIKHMCLLLNYTSHNLDISFFRTMGEAMDKPFQFNITLSIIDFWQAESCCAVNVFYNSIRRTKLCPQKFPGHAFWGFLLWWMSKPFGASMRGSDRYVRSVSNTAPKQLSLGACQRDGDHSFENKIETHYSIPTQQLITKPKSHISGSPSLCQERRQPPRLEGLPASRIETENSSFHLPSSIMQLKTFLVFKFHQWVCGKRGSFLQRNPSFPSSFSLLLFGILVSSLFTVQTELRLKNKQTKEKDFLLWAPL